jgi:hypothetical protein
MQCPDVLSTEKFWTCCDDAVRGGGLSEWLLVVLLAFGLPFDVDVTCPFAFLQWLEEHSGNVCV